MAMEGHLWFNFLVLQFPELDLETDRGGLPTPPKEHSIINELRGARCQLGTALICVHAVRTKRERALLHLDQHSLKFT